MLLGIHIGFAIVSLLLSLFGITRAFQNKGNVRIMQLIAVTAATASFSGIILFINQAVSQSLFQWCAKLGMYLAVIFVSEAFLYYKLRRQFAV